MKNFKVRINVAFKIFKNFKSDNYPPFQKFFLFLNFKSLFHLEVLCEQRDNRIMSFHLKDTTLNQRGGDKNFENFQSEN